MEETKPKQSLWEYRMTTQAVWRIGDRTGKKLIKALATSTRVKCLKIYCEAFGVEETDLFQLAEAIEKNNSLEHLSLSRLLEGTSQGTAAVLTALTNKPKITRLELKNKEEVFAPFEWRALLSFLRSHPQLQRLSLCGAHLTKDQMLELFEVLKENTALVHLNLFSNNDNSPGSLMALAQFIAKSTTITNLKFNGGGSWTKETLAPIFEIMRRCSSLKYVEPNYGLICTIIKPDAWRQNIIYADELGEQNPAPILLPDVTHEPVIQQLSNDILRIILWQLSIKWVLAFRQVDKRIYRFTKDNSFWRGYYTTHFSNIPYDVLLLTDLTYGLKLATTDPTRDIFHQFLFWEEIFINSFRIRKINPAHYPTHNGVSFMEPLYRQYPQLIGTAYSSQSFTALPPDRTILKYKDCPYANTWFLLYARDSPSIIYHLGFEKLADGQINGILFSTSDYPAAWDERFRFVRYLFDWFAAKNESEFSRKLKQLVEPFLAARETNVTQHSPSPQYYRQIDDLLKNCTVAREKALDNLNATMASLAKNFCNSNPNPKPKEFVQKVEVLMNKFKEFNACSSESDISRYRQQMPPRSLFNEKYQDGIRFHNFYYHTWDYSEQDTDKSENNSTTAQKKKEKPTKKIPSVMVMKLYRVVLNFIMMPVLRTFWPEDIDHSNYNTPMFLHKRLPSLRHLYYSKQYVPFTAVTVGKAYPSHWPIIAVGLATQLIPLIVSFVNELLDGTRKDTSSLTKLIEALDLIPVMPSSVKSFLSSLNK